MKKDEANLNLDVLERFVCNSNALDVGQQMAAIEALKKHVEQLHTALGFYARPLAYDGPNQRNVGQDQPFTPLDKPYVIDITRDGGLTACKALGIVKEQFAHNTH